jgi:hypothetical protein
VPLERAADAYTYKRRDTTVVALQCSGRREIESPPARRSSHTASAESSRPEDDERRAFATRFVSGGRKIDRSSRTTAHTLPTSSHRPWSRQR